MKYNTSNSVFAQCIQASIDSEFSDTRPAPNHTTSRRLCKPKPDIDVCNPQTVESKAARPTASTRSEDRKELYEFFISVGPAGATREEAGLACGMHSNSYYPRCAELAFEKKLLPTGEKRKTRQGNLAAVLTADIFGSL